MFCVSVGRLSLSCTVESPIAFLLFYNELFLYYGICAWGNCPQTYLNKILVLQKRALHLIYFSKPRDHAIPFFIESNCLPLQALFFQQLNYLMYDVHAKTTPKSLLNKFAKINTKHHYNTRLSTKKCFSVKFSRTEKMKKSFTTFC